MLYFLFTNLIFFLSFSLSLTNLYIWFIDIINFFSNIMTYLFYKSLISALGTYANNINESQGEYWTFSKHFLFLYYLVHKFFVSGFSDWNMFVGFWKSFTLVIMFAICEIELVLVSSTSCPSWNSVNLARTTSGWVVYMSIDTLQYLYNTFHSKHSYN